MVRLRLEEGVAPAREVGQAGHLPVVEEDSHLLVRKS